MKYKTEFGLVCVEMLRAFEKERDSKSPYDCIWRSQHRLAEEAAKHVPNENIAVDPDNTQSFIISLDTIEGNVPKFIRLRPYAVHGFDKHYAWDNDGTAPNQGTCDAIIDCLKGWIKWDNIRFTSNAGEEVAGISTADPSDSIIESTEGQLSGNSLRLFRHLLVKKHPVRYDTLKDEVWEKTISDKGVKTAIERLATALNSFETVRFSVKNEYSMRRVSIERLGSK